MLARRVALQQLPQAGILITTNIRFRHQSTKANGHRALILRPYQQECLKICLAELAQRPRSIGVSLPTGSGKTVIFLHLLASLPPPTAKPDATRALVIVGSVEVARQIVKQAQELFPHWRVEIEQGKERASGTADLTVATYQTLLNPRRLEKFSAQHIKAIIVDEAHHAAADSYRRILSHYNTAVDHPDPSHSHFVCPAGQHQIPIVGFSATFGRHDRLALASVFVEIVYHRDVTEMIREGWLCDLRYITVRAKLGPGRVAVNKRTGEFHETYLARVLTTSAMLQELVRTWQEKASQRKSTLVFCVNKKHVSRVQEALCAAGVDARAVTSDTPAAQRAAYVADFKAGKFPVMVNCGVFTEGTDIPSIDCVLIARPTQSSNLLSQMIGRGMRQSHQTGKTDCLVIDFADSKCHLAGLLSNPKFFGRDPAELDKRLRNAVMWAIEKRKSEELLEELQSAGRIPIVEHVEENDPLHIPDQASGQTQLSALSWNNWIYCGEGPGFYVLETSPRGGTFSISPLERDDGVIEYVAQYSPYRHGTKDMVTTSTLGEAIRYCDDLAIQYMGAEYDSLLRAAPSRWEPASDTQKTFIRERLPNYVQLRRRDGGSLSGGDWMREVDEMTTGTAENVITRITHEAPTWKEYYDEELLRQRRESDRFKWGLNDHFDWNVSDDSEEGMWDYEDEDRDRPPRRCFIQ